MWGQGRGTQSSETNLGLRTAEKPEHGLPRNTQALVFKMVMFILTLKRTNKKRNKNQSIPLRPCSRLW